MGNRNRSPPARAFWAYGYEIAPPLSPTRLASIENLLKEEQSQAKRQERTWAGRFVVDERVTHILVVSDNPDQHLDINRRLEGELEKLDAGFSITPPVAVVDRAEWATHADRPPSGPPSEDPIDEA